MFHDLIEEVRSELDAPLEEGVFGDIGQKIAGAAKATARGVASAAKGAKDVVTGASFRKGGYLKKQQAKLDQHVSDYKKVKSLIDQGAHDDEDHAKARDLATKVSNQAGHLSRMSDKWGNKKQAAKFQAMSQEHETQSEKHHDDHLNTPGAKRDAALAVAHAHRATPDEVRRHRWDQEAARNREMAKNKKFDPGGSDVTGWV